MLKRIGLLASLCFIFGCDKKPLQIQFDSSSNISATVAVQEGLVVNNTQVHLQFAAQRATEMALFEGPCDPEQAQWVPYQAEVTWPLPNSSIDGYKQISVLFRNDSDFRSECVTKQILLDTVAPTAPSNLMLSSLRGGRLESPQVLFTPSFDATSGVARYEMRLLNFPDTTEVLTWTDMGLNTVNAHFTQLNLSDMGQYVIEVRAVDLAGNQSSVIVSPSFTVGPFLTISAPNRALASGLYKVRFELSRPAPANTTIYYKTEDGTAMAISDYEPILDGTAIIPQGQTSVEFIIETHQRVSANSNRVFNLVITGTVNVVADIKTHVFTLESLGYGAAGNLKLSPINQVVDISLREESFCVLRSSGKILCAGDQTLSPGGLGHSSNFGLLYSQNNVAASAISVGNDGGCSIRSQDSFLACWGGQAIPNEYGVVNPLGGPEIVISEPILSFSAGFGHSCAITQNHDVRCTGDNPSFQFGTEQANATGYQFMFNDSTLSKVFVGRESTCFLSNQQVKCVGDNTFGILGLPQTTIKSSQLATIPGLNQVTDLALNNDTVCAINAGDVYCWGRNQFNQAGSVVGEFQNVPEKVNLRANASAIAVGESHACAALVDQSIFCWGSNDNGQLGQIKYLYGFSPYFVAQSSTPVTHLEAGKNATCYVTQGIPYCWGGGSLASHLQPGFREPYLPRDYPLGIGKIIRIKSARNLVCALNEAKRLYCWGMGKDSSSMRPGLLHSLKPVSYLSTVSILDFAVGADHVCVIVQGSGQVICIGQNDRGQLGRGNTIDSLMPIPVTGITDAFAIAASFNTTCVLYGVAVDPYCWGDNYANQIWGFGTKNNYPSDFEDTPKTAYFYGTQPDLITASEGTFCARDTALGALYCWGNDYFGQLGIGDTIATSSYPPVVGLSGVGKIFGGGFHFCAVQASGINCWGSNVAGVVGDPTRMYDLITAPYFSPLENVLTMALGPYQTCIVYTDGHVTCAGIGSHGTLGRVSTDDSAAQLTIPNLEGGVTDVVVLSRTNYLAPDGSVPNYLAPTGVLHVPDYNSLRTGACALTLNGNLKCWGAVNDAVMSERQGDAIGNIVLVPTIPWFVE